MNSEQEEAEVDLDLVEAEVNQDQAEVDPDRVEAEIEPDQQEAEVDPDQEVEVNGSAYVNWPEDLRPSRRLPMRQSSQESGGGARALLSVLPCLPRATPPHRPLLV